jgi:hypothetical protein
MSFHTKIVLLVELAKEVIKEQDTNRREATGVEQVVSTPASYSAVPWFRSLTDVYRGFP